MRDRVLLPGRARVRVGEPGPEIDHEPAVAPHGDRRAGLAALLERGRERVADGGECGLATAVQLGKHRTTIARAAELAHTNQRRPGTVYRTMGLPRFLPASACPRARRADAPWCKR